MAEASALEKLRAATLGRDKQFKRQTVKVGDLEIEVRQPNVGQRGTILKAAKALSGDPDKIDLSELQTQAVMQCSFVPGTNQRMYNDADRDALLAEQPGSWFDDVAKVALDLLNVEAEAAAKN